MTDIPSESYWHWFCRTRGGLFPYRTCRGRGHRR